MFLGPRDPVMVTQNDSCLVVMHLSMKSRRGRGAGHGVHRDMTFFSTNVLQIPLLRANHSSHMQKNFPSTGYT